MSIVRKCDICNKELLSNDVYYHIDEHIPLLRSGELDICKCCLERIKREVQDEQRTSDKLSAE